MLTFLLKTLAFLGVIFVGWWVFLGLNLITEGRYIGPLSKWLTKRTRSGAWDVILHVAFVTSASTPVCAIYWAWLDAAPGIPWSEALTVSFAAAACLEADYWLRRRKKGKESGDDPTEEQSRALGDESADQASGDTP